MKLSYGQLWALLFLFRAFTFICSGEGYSVSRITGMAVSVIIQFLIIFPIVKYCRKKGINGENTRHMNIVFAAYFIVAGVVVFWKMLKITAAENFSASGNTVLAVLLLITSFYCSRTGIKTVGRAAVVIAGMFIFSLVVLVLTSVSDIKTDNFRNVYDNYTVWHYAVSDIAESTELPAAVILALYTEKSREKGVCIYFATKFILAAAVTVLGTAISGRVSLISDYPFFELCSFSNPLGVQRSDALFTASCTLIAVLYVTFCIAAVSYFMKNILKNRRKAESV